MEFSLIQDRESVSGLDKETISFLSKAGLTEGNYIPHITFCGVLLSAQKVLVVSPRNSLTGIQQEGLSAAVVGSLILKALDKYNTSARSAERVGATNLGDEAKGLGILSSVIWLLNDYATHGIYTTSEKHRRLNTGKINWNRTINREIPYFGVGEIPVYLNLHTEKLKFGESSPIGLIHAQVIKELDHAFNWIVTGDSKIRLATELDSLPPYIGDLDLKLYLLKKELSSSFADREIKLLSTLITYLESKSQASDNEVLIGVRTFQNVWEEMLRNTIPNVIDINSALPKPAVYLKERNDPVLGRGMITDIVSKNNQTISIIDAKYYRAESHNDIPGWGDLVKQFFYTKAVEKIYPDFMVSSWFAFPGSHGQINKGPVSNIGVINTTTKTELNDDFPPIGCAYFCPVEVIKKYISNKKYSHSTIAALYSRTSLAEHARAY